MRTRLENHKMVKKPVRPVRPKATRPVSAKKGLPRPHKRKARAAR